MSGVSVTSKGQVTIPKHIRDELGIAPGSKVEFELAGSAARMRLAGKPAQSRVEDGPGILNYTGPRIPISDLQGIVAAKKAAQRARG
jgi:AbrB family looped-hinge helix DNA binding protein